MVTPPPTPSHRLWRLPSWLVNHVAGRANRLVAQHFGRLGLRTNYAVLAGLHEFGPASQASLGRQLGIDRSDMAGVLDSLEADGLATRAPDPGDRRRNSIRITPAGIDALRALDGQVDAAQDALLEPLTTSERAHLIDLLQRLLIHHEGYEPRP